jgi:hypothetical protein
MLWQKIADPSLSDSLVVAHVRSLAPSQLEADTLPPFSLHAVVRSRPDVAPTLLHLILASVSPPTAVHLCSARDPAHNTPLSLCALLSSSALIAKPLIAAHPPALSYSNESKLNPREILRKHGFNGQNDRELFALFLNASRALSEGNRNEFASVTSPSMGPKGVSLETYRTRIHMCLPCKVECCGEGSIYQHCNGSAHLAMTGTNAFMGTTYNTAGFMPPLTQSFVDRNSTLTPANWDPVRRRAGNRNTCISQLSALSQPPPASTSQRRLHPFPSTVTVPCHPPSLHRDASSLNSLSSSTIGTHPTLDTHPSPQRPSKRVKRNDDVYGNAHNAHDMLGGRDGSCFPASTKVGSAVLVREMDGVRVDELWVVFRALKFHPIDIQVRVLLLLSAQYWDCVFVN